LAEGSVPAAAAVAHTGGMSDVMLVCAGVTISGALLVGLFRAARSGHRR
jgi:hypothetical protein